ncbi:hypothetical protein TMatcc_000516 [Talaromyces marneffei ATCC 18224]|nr:uncharacterized protein EYB26_003091 [Talaromyces marneffei]KAE8549508.1 hypothetical protein EYB25_008030 [Talaromyces marneffei]QGA15433.1 hypothetical protein EYB26_003091 [Talaromyces marneffei]
MAVITSLRLPVLYDSAASVQHSGPSIDWLSGRWHISHSSLPMWRDKRNCTVDYAPLAPAASMLPRVDDMVHYQMLNSDSVSQIHAINTGWKGNPAGWTWRGTGWITQFISCDWEIFGYGELSGGGHWMIMHFRATWLSKAGLDLFTRGVDGTYRHLEEAEYTSIIEEVEKLATDHPELSSLISEFRRVQNDGANTRATP